MKRKNIVRRLWPWLALDLWANGFLQTPLVPKACRYLLLGVHPRLNLGRSHIQRDVQWWGGSTVAIGARSTLSRGVRINHSAPVTIGSRVAIGPGCMILTASHEIGPTSERAGQGRSLPVTIKDGAWLGANVTVLPGVTIERGCVIAAGAVVTEDTEPDSLYGGVPARLVRVLT